MIVNGTACGLPDWTDTGPPGLVRTAAATATVPSVTRTVLVLVVFVKRTWPWMLDPACTGGGREPHRGLEPGAVPHLDRRGLLGRVQAVALAVPVNVSAPGDFGAWKVPV